LRRSNEILRQVSTYFAQAEMTHWQCWTTRQDVELTTLKCVYLQYNNLRLMEPTGYISPVEAEKAYYASLNDRDVAT
jgi:putative transposase